MYFELPAIGITPIHQDYLRRVWRVYWKGGLLSMELDLGSLRNDIRRNEPLDEKTEQYARQVMAAHMHRVYLELKEFYAGDEYKLIPMEEIRFFNDAKWCGMKTAYFDGSYDGSTYEHPRPREDAQKRLSEHAFKTYGELSKIFEAPENAHRL